MGELTRVESWWWGRGCDVGESLIEVLGLKGQVLGNKNCSLSGPSSLLPSSPFRPPSLPSFISSLFPLFSFLSLANINWLLSYGKIRFWHTKVNCFLPEKFPFLSRLPGGWTHGRKKKGCLGWGWVPESLRVAVPTRIRAREGWEHWTQSRWLRE